MQKQKNENSPFTSKGYPFRKDFSSYDPNSLGRAFFSDGYVSNRNAFEVFDQSNILNQSDLKDEPLFYKEQEIPIYVFTTYSNDELLDKYNKLEINYNEIAVFFIKEPQEKEVEVAINLGDSLLKVSNLKDEQEMENKRWTISETDFNELSDNFSAKQLISFLNKKNELFNEDVENVTGLFVKKPKVHFKIGLFFDGTGNNRFNSEQVYYKKLNNSKLVYTKIPPFKEIQGKEGKVTIDNSSSYWNPYSNIVLLYDLYKEENIQLRTINNEINVTLKQYIQGIGTLEGKEDDVLGSAFGEGERGIIGKVAVGCNDLAKQISDILKKGYDIGSLTFDIFGFSRGAASARHFCNEILNDSSIKDLVEKSENSSYKNQGNTRVDKVKFLPKGKTYTLGMLGIALKNHKSQYEINELFNDEPKVKIRFLGLFDTVVSQIITKNKLGKKLDLVSKVTKIPFGTGNYIETKLDVIKQRVDNLPISTIVHFVAKDEWRENFASTRINADAINKDKKRKAFEYFFDGSHSDVGGGYAAMKQDIDILDYDEFSSLDNSLVPKPNRLETLMKYYINNGYCANDQEIKIDEKNFTILLPNLVTIKQVHYQLIATRNIIPRYSVIPMFAMKELAQKTGVIFENNNTSQKYTFEYSIPESLKKYSHELIENINLLFQWKKEKKSKIRLQKNKFIHLSSNYNASKGIERKGESISGIRSFDKIFYVNAPNYGNYEKTIYKREIYNHNK